MKSRLRATWLLLVGVVIGFALGRYTSEKPTVNSLGNAAPTNSLRAVAVDCYDANGQLLPDQFAKSGGVTTSCAPGQTARVHQPPASATPAHDK